MLDRIAECHKIEKKALLHMLFTQNGKCLVFERQDNPNAPGLLGVYLTRETFCKDDLKYRFDLNLKYDNLRGDMNCIFQDFSEKGSN